jgi:uncharacterized protein (DUF488 family)
MNIRSIPRSRTNPQFNLDALPETLASWQIGHIVIPELGGLRKKSKTISPDVNGFWSNQSFHNYADYALSDEFRLGLSRLLEVSQDRRCAIMCSTSCCRSSGLQSLFMDAFGTVTKTADLRPVRSQILNSG